MAAPDPKEFANLAKEMQVSMAKLASVMSGLDSMFGSIADKSGRITRYAKDQNDQYQKGGTQLAGIRDLNSDLKKSLEDQVKSQQVKTLATKTGIATEIIELQLARQLAIAEAQRAGASGEMLTKIRRQYDEAVKLTKERVKENKILEYEQKIAEKIEEIEDNRFKMLDGINSKMRVMKDILTDQRVAAAYAFSAINKGYHHTKEMISEVRKEGHTVSQAFHEVGLAISDTFSLTGASAKDSLEVMSGMRSEMGSVHHVTREARLEAASLAKTFGVSNEEAGKLTAQFATMPGATMESANNSLEFAGNLAKAAHVAPGEVMKSIAGSAEDVAIYTKDGGKNIGTAAVAAKKLGLEFGTLTKMTDNLLDFENSINKQMEASVLLGREINLDKAREAALNGDLLGATKEILANVGGEAEFNKMNVIQRKALAESMGVSVADLSKMVKHQDELASLTEEQQQALATGELSMDEALANAGGLSSKLADGTKNVLASVVGFGGMVKGIKEAGQEAKSLFSGFKNFREGIKDGGGIKGGIKGMLGMDKVKEGGAAAAGSVDKVKDLGGDKTKDLAGDKIGATADKTKGVKGDAGKGIREFLTGLAEGLKKFADMKVIAGAASMAISGVLFAAGMFAIAKIFGMLSIEEMLKAAIGLPVFAGAFWLTTKILGKIDLGSVVKGALALALIGAALIPAAFAFSLLKGVDVGSIIAFSIALPLLGLAAAGLGFLFPFIAAGAASLALLGVGMIAVAGGLMILQAAQGGIAVFESLTAVAANAAGLGGVALAMVGIAYGLGAMAIAGFAALPIIGALIGLATVAPALSGLGASLGGMFGGGGGEESDQMDKLIGKIDQLIAVASSGGEVKMDGKKVGEVIRLGLNSAGVR